VQKPVQRHSWAVQDWGFLAALPDRGDTCYSLTL
jgi:hypothetical protein